MHLMRVKDEDHIRGKRMFAALSSSSKSTIMFWTNELIATYGILESIVSK
jgi:hypothetical protein